MSRSHTTVILPKALIFGLAISFVTLAPAFLKNYSTVLGQTNPLLPIPSGTPAAVIKRIVVSNPSLPNPTPATVIRGGSVAPLTAGLLLYRGDSIETFERTQVTVLFLDPPVSERDNEVIIDAGAKVSISSTYSWWGRVWVKVKGAFESKSEYVQLGARGTEYEFNVFKDQQRGTVIVLEGTVEGKKGAASPPAGRVFFQDPLWPRTHLPAFMLASFAPSLTPQDQFGRPLNVDAGQVVSYTVSYNLHTDCRQAHNYEFRTSDDTDWLQVLGDKRVQLGPGETKSLSREVRVDATKLFPGVYRAHVYVVCVDCRTERNCNQAQLDFAYRITVRKDPVSTVTPTPTPSPSPDTKQVFLIRELEESALTRGTDRPSRVTDERALQVIDWTNKVILPTQPTYSTEGLIPHFSTTEQRSQSFRDARPRALLRHEASANKTLGDVYSDWGQAALAVSAYDKIASLQTLPGSSAIDKAEAYRLTGALAPDESLSLSDAESKSAAAQNFFGNSALDKARVALDQGKTAQAKSYLEEAERFYASARQAQTRIQGGPTSGSATIQTNQAKAQIAGADLVLLGNTGGGLQQPGAISVIAPQASDVQTAKSKYAGAMRILEGVQQAESTYPFGVKELGRVYQGLGHAAILEGNAVAATDSYAKAKDQYNRVIGAHSDCAEVYFNLGDLAEDTGDREAAKDYYRRAIKARPEQPTSYYSLALLVQTENPREAAALAATYLQLEPAVFKQGQKARNAERISNGDTVGLPPRILPPPVVPVPNVLGKTLTDAFTAIESAGFTRGRTERQTDAKPEGTVLSQTPAGDARASRQTAIDLVISSGPGEPIVPNVVGQSQKDATAAIESAGFTRGRTERRTDAKPEGTVLGQTPDGDARAPRQTAIDLVISSGPGITEPIVPNVVDKNMQDARTAIESVGLKVGRVKEKSEDNKARGMVVKQTPKAGKKVAANSVVDLEVSAGKLVEVPNIVKDKEQTARKKLADKGFVVGNVSQRADCDLVGKVIEQSKPPKLKVEVGTAIDLVLGSVGENPVTVPNFVGRNRRDVDTDIRERRFILGRDRTEETDDAPAGTVVRQSPPEGTKFARDCPVQIELTIAVPLTTVGDYVGMSELEARRQLSGIGLSADVRYQESRGNPGIVLNQSPPPGSRVRRSFPITLTVSVQPVKVPNVIGKNLEEARQILANAGLGVGTVRRVTDGRDYSPGSVVGQNPNPEQMVPAGTRVNLDIYAPPRQQNVTVPPVRGLPEKDAVVKLERAGLRVGNLGCIQNTQVMGLGVGNAAGTNPPEGASVPAGTPVTLTIGRTKCGPN